MREPCHVYDFSRKQGSRIVKLAGRDGNAVSVEKVCAFGTVFFNILW